MLYILIFEDGEIWCAKELSQDDFNSADDGILDILRIDEPGTVPKQYANDAWHEIKLI